MGKETNTIKCPECGAEINVSDILFHQVQETLKKDFDEQNAKKDADYKKKLQDLKNAKEQLDKDKETAQQQVDAAVKAKLSTEKTKLEKTIRLQIDEEKSGQVSSLEAELKLKSDQVKELNKTKADNARLQREKDELRGTIEAEEAEKFNKQLTLEKEKIKSAETEKSKTELQKRDKLIDDLNTRLADAQTKLEQGSNKLSGEVKEIELRDFLKLTFPIDEVKDVPSGITGADVFHLVKNNLGQQSGVILYERKQTQTFGKDWISKLKEDGRRVKADICVIVTRTMPKENIETHFNDGVWVCTFDDIKIITTLLRDGLIKQYSALISQSDKGTKAEMLYDYLRSNDFQNHIVGILDAFKKMDRALNKDKEDSLKKFAERDAHIFQAKQSIISFWGRVDGIATDSLNQEMKILENSTLKQIE
jgi:hypothetical protein